MRHDLQNPTLVFCPFRPITVYNDADHGSHKLPHSTLASGLLKPLKPKALVFIFSRLKISNTVTLNTDMPLQSTQEVCSQLASFA